MSLLSLKSAYSFYDSRDAKFKASSEKTKFSANPNYLTIVTTINGFNDLGYRSTFGTKISKNTFDLEEQGNARRIQQLGTGTKFPIGPTGEVHEFDIKRLGFSQYNRYEDTYNKLSNSGLADTYTKDSPIDDMYNIIKVRDESSDRLYFKEPFILRGIQRNDNSKTQRFGPDSNLDIPRGGMITNVTRSTLDVLRIGKFLTTPKGLSFTAKQIGLQLMNPNTEGSTGVTQLPVGTDSSKIYSTKNLLKNIGGVGRGLHFRRHGTVPESIQIFDKSRYEDVLIRARSTIGEKLRNNRLVKLHKELIDKKNELSSQFVKKTIKLLSGIGGPNSNNGVGTTDIKRYEITTTAPTAENTPSTEIETFDKRKLKFQDQIENESGNSFSMPEKTNVSLKDKLKDFDGIGIKQTNPGKAEESKLDKIKNYKTLAYGGIRNINKDRNITKIIDYGRTADTTRSGDDQYRFDVTKTRLFEKFKEAGKNISNDKNVSYYHEDNESHNKDFITLKISDSSIAPSGVKFLSYLTSLDDDLQKPTELKNINNNPDATRDGKQGAIAREISVGFIVAANSPSELSSIYTRLNTLRQMVAAYDTTTSNKNAKKKGRQKLTVGDMIYEIRGYLESVAVSWDTEIPWEITDGSKVPLALNITINFTVATPGKSNRYAFGRNGVVS
jgi:hypothetical protein